MLFSFKLLQVQGCWILTSLLTCWIVGVRTLQPPATFSCVIQAGDGNSCASPAARQRPRLLDPHCAWHSDSVFASWGFPTPTDGLTVGDPAGWWTGRVSGLPASVSFKALPCRGS